MTDRQEVEDRAALLRDPRFPSSKFAVPKLSSRLVHRTRLIDRLDRGEQARLTLVVASPGAGKTVVLAEWLSIHPEWPVAWVNCDGADAEPVRFLAAVVEAARRGAGRPELGEDSLQLLHVDREVSADAVAALADDLERYGAPRVVVLDDFHLTGEAGADALRWLVDYHPPSLQIVVATRLEPRLRLHRMRANEELVEVRDADLSFTADEAKLFLNEFGVQASDEDIAILRRRSEGWAAGLQMAAISIQNAADGRKVAERAALHRHMVAGYFLDEVLYMQPPPVVEFMLATSVLDELSVLACTAVNGPGSDTLLDQVYRDHLFLTMVDEDTGSYRYHPLIREVLRAELHARNPSAERRYHQRAATHLATNGRVGLAARHLLAAGDRAAAFQMLSDGVIVDMASNPALSSAFDDVNPDDFAGVADILVPLGVELLLRGSFGSGARAFQLAQSAPIDPGQQRELALRFEILGAGYHSLAGEAHEALAHRQRALGLADAMVGVDIWRAGLDGISMYDHLYLGDFAQALQLADAVATAEVIPPAAREVLCPGLRSQVAWAQGELTSADAWATSALASAARLGFGRHYFAFNSLRTKTLLALERRDLDGASEVNEHILGSLVGGRPAFEYLAQLDRAHIWMAEGHLDDALASLPDARHALRSERSVLLSQADELEARLHLALGDRDGAERVASRLPIDRRLVLLAIIALAVGDASKARTLLEAGSAERNTVRSHAEFQLLGAEFALLTRAHQAARVVRDALDTAARRGFVLTVLETAPRVVDHLISESVSYPRSEYLTGLFGAALRSREYRVTRVSRDGLPDPLTEAEVRVLRKLSQRLTYGDIASDLHLSLNTVKTHVRHSYMKLDVTSRSAAIKRAASLGVL